MKRRPKYILHSPISDGLQLEQFVERCLKEKASLLAIFGTDCSGLEDLIDDIVIGDGSDADRFLCTTSHPDEALEDVLSFAQKWEADDAGEIHQVRI
ncbi:hypothetical protein [Ruegeria sp. EL01]|jgi:hypothetical protein|uniref:hypothetical protein n=1 Tax=Ruegeria sp. EL01 TaxID=2107578 RepID=UPI001C1FBA45|nr:hypothetical protein [Ruegeria sp. EL01]